MARVNEESTATCVFIHNGMNHLSLLASRRPGQTVTTLLPVLIFHPTEGRRLSWPEWLVTNRGGLPAHRRSPVPVLTGPGVEQLC